MIDSRTSTDGAIPAVSLLIFGLQMTVPKAGQICLMAIGLASAIAAILGLKTREVRYHAALLIAGAGIVAAPFDVRMNRPGFELTRKS